MKKPATAFESAVQGLAGGLSPEAVTNLTSMVTDVARKYGYDDSLMIRRLMNRLRRAAKRKPWALEVLENLENPKNKE